MTTPDVAAWRIVPLFHVATEVAAKNVGGIEGNLLSLSYGRIVRKDIHSNEGLLPESFEGYQIVQAGDTVLRLTDLQNDQRSLRTGFVTERGIITSAYLALTPTRADPRFLSYVLYAHDVSKTYYAMGGGLRQSIKFDDLKRLPVILPPLEEQRRIADFLDDQVTRIDNIIAARQQQMANLQMLERSAVVGTLLAGGQIAASGASGWYAALPEGWRIAPLRALALVVDCKHRTPKYVDEGFPVVSPGDIGRERLDLTRCNRFVDADDYEDLADDLRRCRRGDLVYSRNASAGSAAYVDTDRPFTMGQDVCRITSGDFPLLYMFYALNFLVDPQLDSVRVGSTFTRINVDQIKALRVPVGPWDQLECIAEAADALVAAGRKSGAYQALQLERLQELKRSLISAAVSGEFDVTSASRRGGPA